MNQATDYYDRRQFQNGTVVGQLPRGYEVPTGMCCASTMVMAVVNWDRERS